MTPATDLTALNHRLTALDLPILNTAVLMDLPSTLSVTRIKHTLSKAEKGEIGARRFLAKYLLPASTPSPVPPRPTATPNTVHAAHTKPVSPPSSPPVSTGTYSDRVQCRIYGGKAALCIESDHTRQNEPTLRIEAARATAPREYDWKQKLTLQLTREELPVVTATVLGLLARCEHKNHGPEKDKGLEIVHQGTHLFLRLFQKERGVLAIPVTAADSYALGALCLRQLRKTSPWLSDQGVMTLLKLTVQRLLTSAG